MANERQNIDSRWSETLLYVARGRHDRPYTEGRRHIKEERGNPATRQKEEGTQKLMAFSLHLQFSNIRKMSKGLFSFNPIGNMLNIVK